jgi:hypothetical protein
MKERIITRSDAKIIAETACDLADKALHWKARALAAEEALSKFAGEVYGRKPLA